MVAEALCAATRPCSAHARAQSHLLRRYSGSTSTTLFTRLRLKSLSDAVDQARTRGSAVLLVRLNTPGGLMDCQPRSRRETDCISRARRHLGSAIRSACRFGWFLPVARGRCRRLWRPARTPAPHLRSCSEESWIRSCGAKSRAMPEHGFDRSRPAAAATPRLRRKP